MLLFRVSGLSLHDTRFAFTSGKGGVLLLEIENKRFGVPGPQKYPIR